MWYSRYWNWKLRKLNMSFLLIFAPFTNVLNSFMFIIKANDRYELGVIIKWNIYFCYLKHIPLPWILFKMLVSLNTKVAEWRVRMRWAKVFVSGGIELRYYLQYHHPKLNIIRLLQQCCRTFLRTKEYYSSERYSKNSAKWFSFEKPF